MEISLPNIKFYYKTVNSTLFSELLLSLLFLLLLLSRIGRVQLCATPQTAAHQALPSLGFSRQEYWSGVPLPSPHPPKLEVSHLPKSLADTLQPLKYCQLLRQFSPHPLPPEVLLHIPQNPPQMSALDFLLHNTSPFLCAQSYSHSPVCHSRGTSLGIPVLVCCALRPYHKESEVAQL